ncbi:hypothetical protein AVEN_205897-1 [Araneus ventricosus]|uniref:Uncharacterized protein n=1 Tax=Araneus ventricosus TaxID=182803 RepID=A0A4Y2M2H4_ARAVE|nr:hypothetical protein AVEN_205897-1 [Araneus ventricosus]
MEEEKKIVQDFSNRWRFTLQNMQNMKRWNIFGTDEVHFPHPRYVNTQNCRIWATGNPFGLQPVLFILKSNCAGLSIVYRRAILFRRDRSCGSCYLHRQ